MRSGVISLSSNSSVRRKVTISFDKSMILKIFFVILSFLISFFAQKMLYKPQFGTMIDFDMDSSGNVYILSVDERSEQYKVTKVDNLGYVNFEQKLDKSPSGKFFSYRDLEVDSKGNFFIIQEIKDKDVAVSNSSQYPISKEKIEMFSYTGKKIKTVAEHDFSSEGISSTDEYIKKIQVINQKLSIMCANGNMFEVHYVNPYVDESPSKGISFKVNPPTVDDYNWVNDLSISSDGNVFYSTKSGNFYMINSADGSMSDLKTLLPSSESSVSCMSIDAFDNIFFTDLRTGNFYKFSGKTNNGSLLYSIENNIKINDLKIKDLRRIYATKEGYFYASSKSFINPYYVQFGNVNNLISNIRYHIFPYGILFIILGACILLLLFFLIWKISTVGFKRTYISLKATFMFLPAFLIAVSLIVVISTKKSLDKYTKVLRQNQSIGAKIVAQEIKYCANLLPNMIYGQNYMSKDFSSMKVAINNACNDIKDKVGDNSDYIVIYTSDGSKIYSVTSNKYSGSYSYYEDLKFADPDMVDDSIAIVDSFLERDEIETIYSSWSSLKDSDQSSIISKFRDVHGDLIACFAPIKDDKGNIVGMVGNFLDENSHVRKKFLQILKESSLFVGISSILIFAYLCFIMWILLRPMRVLNSGISEMINGHWKNRVPIVSKDEFARISVAFNNMSNKLETYTDNLMDLNTEYLRFVPKKLLNLMGKDKITETNVGDGSSSEMSIVYITFNISKIEKTNNFENNLFLQLKQSYLKIFDIVEKNNGVVQNFASLGATLIFKDPMDALRNSIQILETSEDNIVYKNMRISTGYGPLFVGLIGNDVRRGVSIASEEMQRLIKIDKGMKKINVNFSATESMISKIRKEFDPSLFRLIGRLKDISELTWIKLYEIISSSDTLRKEYNIRTKSMFERAVQLYIDGSFDQARKLFVDILNINKDDSVSLYYINMCDIKLNNIDKNYGLKIGEILEI